MSWHKYPFNFFSVWQSQWDSPHCYINGSSECDNMLTSKEKRRDGGVAVYRCADGLVRGKIQGGLALTECYHEIQNLKAIKSRAATIGYLMINLSVIHGLNCVFRLKKTNFIRSIFIFCNLLCGQHHFQVFICIFIICRTFFTIVK